MSKYRPTEGSVAYKVIEFFTTNPDEVLTLDDLSVKFGKHRAHFHGLLAMAVESGVLKRQTNADEELVYLLGDGTPVIKAKPGAHPSARVDALLAGGALGAKVPQAPQAPAAARPAKKRARVWIDVSAVQLRDNVPLPPSHCRPHDFEDLLKRMKKGQMCELPHTVRATLGKHLTSYKKKSGRAFETRKLNEEAFGLWRVS